MLNGMSKGVNVRITGRLLDFVREQAGSVGMYENSSEYVRDLIRRDYERQKAEAWDWLSNELTPGMSADKSEFVPLNAGKIKMEGREIAAARSKVRA